MGRKRNRKRERLAGNRRQAQILPRLDVPGMAGMFDDDELLLALEMGYRDNKSEASPSCGGCQEFIEDQEGGRGTCLHPGSGILSPWTDTPGCPFHQRRRR